MFIRVLQTEHELRKAELARRETTRLIEQGTKLPTVAVPSKYEGPDWLEGHPVQLEQLDSHTARNTKCQHLMDMHNFIRLSKWQPTTLGQNGTSWLELLLRYATLKGSCYPPGYNDGPLDKLPKLRQHLNAFTTLFKQVATTYVEPGDQQLFSPTRSKLCRLKHYGITNHMPCIAAHLCLHEQDKLSLHTTLASLAGDLTTTKVQALHQGTLRSKVQRLRFGRPLTGRLAHSTNTAGDDAATEEEASPTTGEQPLPNFRERAKQRAEEQAEEIRSSEVKPASLTLACHSCLSTRTLTCKQLLCGTSWKPLYCSNCSLSRKACKWLCTCEEPWHTCLIHRRVGMAVHKQGLAKPVFHTSTRVVVGKRARSFVLGSANPLPRKRRHKDCGDAAQARVVKSKGGFSDRNTPACQPGPCPASAGSLVPGPLAFLGQSLGPALPAPACPAVGPRPKAAPVKRKPSLAQDKVAKMHRTSSHAKPSSNALHANDSNTSQRMLEYARRGIIQMGLPHSSFREKEPEAAAVQSNRKRTAPQVPFPNRKRFRFKQTLPEADEGVLAMHQGNGVLGQAWASHSTNLHILHHRPPGIPRIP